MRCQERNKKLPCWQLFHAGCGGAKVPWMLAWKIQLVGFEDGLLFIVAIPCRSEAIRGPVGDKL
jgi:hypothetical protein